MSYAQLIERLQLELRYKMRHKGVGFHHLCEMAVPTDAMRANRFYHGTPNEVAAQSIIKDGIRPPEQVGRGQMAPVAGRSYITDDLHYAIIYALGGDMIGHEFPASFIERNGRYGYVFVIDGSDINGDVQPDEDSVGQAVHFAYDVSVKNAKGEPFYGKDRIYQRLISDKPFAQTLLDFARRAMTTKQYNDTLRGEYAAYASGGKRMIRVMPDWMKLKLIELGAHTAHAGTILPTEAWRIDKLKSKELASQQFWDVAELVWRR